MKSQKCTVFNNPAKSKLLLNSLTNLAKILLNLANSPPSLNYPSAVFKLIKAKSFFKYDVFLI